MSRITPIFFSTKNKKNFYYMKKTYIAPKMSMATINAEELICLSLQQGAADSSDVLGKERGNQPKEESWGNLW